jgi:HAMP domain-containing protein
MRNRGWIIVACVVVVGIVCAMLISRCVQRGVEEIPMEETMASIEEIRPRG